MRYVVKNHYLRTRKFNSSMNLLTKEISRTMTSAAVMVCLLSSCWDDNTSETIVTDYHNALINSVTLGTNANVCSALANYTFTIDHLGTSDTELVERCRSLWDVNEKANDGTDRYYVLEPGIIFNVDSLPVGSIADSIKVTLSTYSSAVYIYQYDEELQLKKRTNYADTQIVWFDDYAVNRIEVLAKDGYTKKSYFMKMNVHQTSSDTIRWHYAAVELFNMSDVIDQRVDTIGTDLYWYGTLSDQSQWVRTASLTGNVKEWSEACTVSAPAPLQLGTLYNWKNTLYAVATDGVLLSSTDGKQWNAASSDFTFVNLLGNQLAAQDITEHLCAIVQHDGNYHFGRSEDGTTWMLDTLIIDDERTSRLPADFPISDYSRPIAVAQNIRLGNNSSRIYISCGVKADGTLTASTWSTDGRQWAEFKQGFLRPNRRASIVRYTLNADHPDTFWIMQTGEMENGAVSDTLYFSENNGVTWKRLSREFPQYGDTSPLNPFGCSSAFYNPKDYTIYFFGGKDLQGRQQSDIAAGQLISLAMKKKR